MGKLRDRMIEEMKLRNFSPAPQESYVYAVSGPLSRARFSKFSERPNGYLAEDLNRSRAWISPRRARAMRLNKAMNTVRYSQQICLP